MEKDKLLGREVEILTIPEFTFKKQKYYSESGNEDKVIKCFSPSGYQFWTKHRTLEDIGKIYWKHEPLLKRWFTEESQVIEELKAGKPKGIAGCSFRWLPGNMSGAKEVVLQPDIVPKEKSDEYILNMVATTLSDKMFGMLMDPYVFVEDLKLDGEYINSKASENGDPSKYRVFCMEISTEEYDKEEKSYIESIRTPEFNDGLIYSINYKNFELTKEFIEFLKVHTKYKYEEEEEDEF